MDQWGPDDGFDRWRDTDRHASPRVATVTALLLVAAPPIGLILMWWKRPWTYAVRVTLTLVAIVAAVVVAAALSSTNSVGAKATQPLRTGAPTHHVSTPEE